MLKEFLNLIEANPSMKDGVEGFTVQELAEALPRELGGRTYPNHQVLNIASRLRVFLPTLEELGYLEKCALGDRRKVTYKLTGGAYRLLLDRTKKAKG